MLTNALHKAIPQAHCLDSRIKCIAIVISTCLGQRDGRLVSHADIEAAIVQLDDGIVLVDRHSDADSRRCRQVIRDESERIGQLNGYFGKIKLIGVER